MDNVIEIVTNNGLVSSLVAATILGFVGWAWMAKRNRKDRKRIYEFLTTSKSDTKFTFRSTEAIASHTKLTEERVETLWLESSKDSAKRERKEILEAHRMTNPSACFDGCHLDRAPVKIRPT